MRERCCSRPATLLPTVCYWVLPRTIEKPTCTVACGFYGEQRPPPLQHPAGEAFRGLTGRVTAVRGSRSPQGSSVRRPDWHRRRVRRLSSSKRTPGGCFGGLSVSGATPTGPTWEETKSGSFDSCPQPRSYEHLQLRLLVDVGTSNSASPMSSATTNKETTASSVHDCIYRTATYKHKCFSFFFF